MDDLNEDLKTKLRAALDAGISDETMKAVKKQVDNIIYDIESDLHYRVKEELAPHLVAYVDEMVKKAINSILEGNEREFRRYLGCEKRGVDGEYISWTGRSDSEYWGRKREPHEWHPVIHGNLHGGQCVELRRALVEAHRDLITSERILDLEDQVKSLVAQVNRANVEKEVMLQRVRAAGW